MEIKEFFADFTEDPKQTAEGIGLCLLASIVTFLAFCL